MYRKSGLGITGRVTIPVSCPSGTKFSACGKQSARAYKLRLDQREQVSGQRPAKDDIDAAQFFPQ